MTLTTALAPVLPAAPAAQSPGWLRRFVVIALIAFLTLVDLFATQAIIPDLTRLYGVTPGEMGVAVNASTIGMAIASLGVAIFSRHLERRRSITAALALLALPTAALSLAPDLTVFAALRIAQGLCMATAFSLTLAWLGERSSKADAATAFAAYVTGNVASNLFGRLISASVTGQAGVESNFLLFAALNLAGAVLAASALGGTQRCLHCEQETAATSSNAWEGLLRHLRRPAMLAGFGAGFCILFAFLGVFTYVNFVLVGPEIGLPMAHLGLVYLVFGPAMISTPIAGAMAERFGQRLAMWLGLGVALLGLLLLALPSLVAMLLGMTLVGMGTFFAQGIATGYVNRTAEGDRAAASGLYLASYFSGGLAGSWILGRVFETGGWESTLIGVAAALTVAALLVLAFKGSQAQPTLTR